MQSQQRGDLALIDLLDLPGALKIADPGRAIQEAESMLIERQPVCNPAPVPNDRPFRVVRNAVDHFRTAGSGATDGRLRCRPTGVIQEPGDRPLPRRGAHAEASQIAASSAVGVAGVLTYELMLRRPISRPDRSARR